MSFGGYIKAFGKQPGHPYHTFWIRNDLKELQRFVGGYIETVTVAPKLVLICNEEGRLQDMGFNCEICGINFVGPILAVGTDDEGNFTDMPDWAVEFLRENTED